MDCIKKIRLQRSTSHWGSWYRQKKKICYLHEATCPLCRTIQRHWIEHDPEIWQNVKHTIKQTNKQTNTLRTDLNFWICSIIFSSSFEDFIVYYSFQWIYVYLYRCVHVLKHIYELCYVAMKDLKSIKNCCRCAADNALMSRISVVHWRTNEDLCKTDVISCREDVQSRKWPNTTGKDLNIWHLTLKTCLMFGKSKYLLKYMLDVWQKIVSNRKTYGYKG